MKIDDGESFRVEVHVGSRTFIRTVVFSKSSCHGSAGECWLPP